MRIVRKLLHVIPKRYNQISCAIEMFSHLNTMSVEELIGKLRATEDPAIDDGVGCLLLIEEQWEAHRCSNK
jgi:hypothetical protein